MPRKKIKRKPVVRLIFEDPVPHIPGGPPSEYGARLEALTKPENRNQWARIGRVPSILYAARKAGLLKKKWAGRGFDITWGRMPDGSAGIYGRYNAPPCTHDGCVDASDWWTDLQRLPVCAAHLLVSRGLCEHGRPITGRCRPCDLRALKEGEQR